MDNRFDLRHIALDPYLLDLSDVELECEPVYRLVTAKGKQSDGTLNTQGILQMYLLDLALFFHGDDYEIVSTRRGQTVERFTCPNRAHLVEDLADVLATYDRLRAGISWRARDSMAEESEDWRDQAQDRILSMVEQITLLYEGMCVVVVPLREKFATIIIDSSFT